MDVSPNSGMLQFPINENVLCNVVYSLSVIEKLEYEVDFLIKNSFFIRE